MPTHGSRLHSELCFASGMIMLVIALVAVVCLFVSRSDPWLFGVQNEPRWSFAVGSGRLKIWVAEETAGTRDESWTSSWYRGLDGQPFHWDFTIDRGSTGGIHVIAIPLWAIGGFFGIAGACLLRIGVQDRR